MNQPTTNHVMLSSSTPARSANQSGASSSRGEGSGGTGEPAKSSQGKKLESYYESPPEAPEKQKGIVIAAVAVGAAGVLFGIGMMFRGGDTPPAAPAPVAESAPNGNFMTEQQKMMREAIDLAKEAQKLQKERMELMKREMEGASEAMMSEEPR